MKTPTKGISLMGNRYTYGGVCLTSNQELYVTANGCNKLVCYDNIADAIIWSANAMGYATFCDVQSQCYLESPAYNPSIIFLLKNGEVWRKDLTDFSEEKWGDPNIDVPECRGASGIEFYNNSLYVTFPQFNCVRRMALQTLGLVSQMATGVPTQSPYPPAAISYDGVSDRFALVDPVKGDVVFVDPASFNEVGRERYTFDIYNRCFDGDITFSRSPLPEAPGKNYFITCVESHILQYTEPWYDLYEIDDLTGTSVQVDAVIMDNVEVGENVIKHYQIKNRTPIIKQAVTISVTDDPTIMADDRTWVSASGTGPWEKTVDLGDANGNSSIDFYLRFHPQYGIDLGSFSVELVVDYTPLP